MPLLAPKKEKSTAQPAAAAAPAKQDPPQPALDAEDRAAVLAALDRMGADIAEMASQLKRSETHEEKNMALQLTPEEEAIITARRAEQDQVKRQIEAREARQKLADNFLTKPIGKATPEETAAARGEIAGVLKELGY